MFSDNNINILLRQLAIIIFFWFNKVVRKFFEIIPASIAWLTIVAMFLLSYLTPTFVAIFIILFDIYWLLKTIFLSFHLNHAYSEMKKNLKIDWLTKLKNLGVNKNLNINYDDVYHLILLPFYKESHEVIKESLESILNSNYDKNKFIIILGAEERAQDIAKQTAIKIKKEYEDKFYCFKITNHPANLLGEIPGKGSNESWMGKFAQAEIIDKQNIPYENILVSVFDIDTTVYQEYFGILTYKFLTCKKPLRSSYQPIPLFINNIYTTPALARVVSFSATFWQMMQQARPERLTTFSSHSMPFKALSDIGFWGKDLVSEDSRIFWQCFLHYDSDWKVEPLNYPVSMDSNATPKFWKTMKNIYKQQRRWGWGVENVPYMLEGFRQNKIIPWYKKIYWSFITLEGFHSWATNALLIFALGWLPLYLGGEHFNYSLLSYSLPEVTRFIMTLAMIGIVSSAIMSVILLPSKPKWFKWYHYLIYIIQWVLMPITLIIFGSLPGLEAQTRLALGGRFKLGFWVTPKFRNTK